MVTKTMDSTPKEEETRVDRDSRSLTEVEVVEEVAEEEVDKAMVHLEEAEVDMDKQELTTTRTEVEEEILTVDTTREELEQEQGHNSSSRVATQETATALRTVATNNSLNSNSLTGSSSPITVAILKFHPRTIDRLTGEAINRPSNHKVDQDPTVPRLLVITAVDLLDPARVRDKHRRIKATVVTVATLDKGDNKVEEEVNTGDINRLAGIVSFGFFSMSSASFCSVVMCSDL